MSSDDLIDFGDSVSEKQEIVETNDLVYELVCDSHGCSVTEEPEEVVVEEKKEDSEAMKSLKKGAGLVGGLFKKGWGAVKSGASKANEKFKETEFGKKTVAEVDKFKQTEFAQKVAEGSRKTGAAIKEGAKKTGAAMKEGAQKVRDSEFGQKMAEGAKKTGAAMKEGAQKMKEKSAPALEKAKENMKKLGQDIKASMDQSANDTSAAPAASSTSLVAEGPEEP